MRKVRKTFGFYPRRLQVEAGPIKVSTLPEFERIATTVFARDEVEKDWISAPPQQVCDFLSGEVREQPYRSRVFDLPKTHMIEHVDGTCEEHIDFHIWALSFFVGMWLTAAEAGFLDATPVKRGKLVDFVLFGGTLVRAVELAESFWMMNCSEPRNAQRFAASVHALFVAQYPHSLEFEKFMYLYTAIDACYKLATSLRQSRGKRCHPDRIAWMCAEFGIETPEWSKRSVDGGVEVFAIRNDTVHEALFMDAPFGFAPLGDGPHGHLTLEMTALVCRLLVALIGGTDQSYLGSPVNTRQRHSLTLS